VRGIIGELKAADGITVIDMEAGLELFGRGTPGASDLLVIVIEPSLWSIQTASRIIDLARELGIPKLIAVANKIREEGDVEWIREALRPLGVEVAGVVPYDTDVSLADRRMRSLLDIAPDSAAARAIRELIGVIEQEVGAAPAPAPESGPNGEDDHGKAADAGCPWVVDAYR
jgi:CO dehydrogenase maturation factor